MRKLEMVLGTMFAVAALVACGGEENGDKGGGEPMARVQGTVQGPGGIAYTSPHVGLVWIHFGDGTVEPDFVEQVTAIDASRMPVSFELSVFQAPPAGSYYAIEGWQGEELGRMAMALVVALDDVNRDGAFAITETGVEAPDRLFGVSFRDVLVHIPAPFSGEGAAIVFSNPEAATPGVHIARLDPCGGNLEIVDDGSFAIETFPASSTFPEELGGDEMSCEPGPGPGTGACADPESENCWTCLDQALLECVTVTCGAELNAITACAESNGCDVDDPEGLCVQAHCAPEIAAVESCMYTCDGWEACYGEPLAE